jgi:hypothetical protein
MKNSIYLEPRLKKAMNLERRPTSSPFYNHNAVNVSVKIREKIMKNSVYLKQ